MSRLTRSILAAALAASLAAPLAAQTQQTAQASADLVIAPMLSVQATQSMQFGTHFATDGTVFTSASVFASFSGVTDVGNHLAVDLLIEPALNKVSGGTGSVPFQCSSNSALITNDVVVARFNPATGLSDFGPVAAPGTFTVKVGDPSGTPGDAQYLCSVAVGNAQRGTYQGFLTLRVTVL